MTTLSRLCLLAAIPAALTLVPLFAQTEGKVSSSHSVLYSAPAGTLPAQQHYQLGNFDAAVLPNGRFVTPPGIEVSVQAPKPFGMALSPDGGSIVTTNSGVFPFSATLITGANTATPVATLLNLDATFMGAAFSPDSKTFYIAGGEDGVIWVGNVPAAKIVGVVNVNGTSKPLTGPVDPTVQPTGFQQGTFPGNLVVSKDGHWLYVVDQATFQVHAIDTTQIVTGLDAHGLIIEANNFAALAGSATTGRYPFGIGISPDGKSLFVASVGMFEYTHLTPPNPTGDPNIDYPLCYPALAYPQDSANDKTIDIVKANLSNLTPALSLPNAIRCGYVPANISFTEPGLGDPNATPASSVYVFNIAADPGFPSFKSSVKTGPLVGEVENGIAAYSGSHPNAVAASAKAIYVANGNNDSISVLDPASFKELSRINLTVLPGYDGILKGVQPVSVTLSPDGKLLYASEAGINAVAVVDTASGTVLGHIPTGWWPSQVAVSSDGKTLFLASANGRGATPNDAFPPGSPKYSTLGTVNIIPTPSKNALATLTSQVMRNNGFNQHAAPPPGNPIPNTEGTPSTAIHHVIFINKENSSYDQLLGDITVTRKGVPVNGDPSFSLGPAVTPNHHELALEFTVGDNFFLEPSVSSDGHRWLTNTYTTEFEQTHWPASYGGKRGDAGDNPDLYNNYFGRLGFTDANGSPAPEDYNQQGGVYLHLIRNGRTFVNFGNGFEFAEVDESHGEEPTGIRNHVNTPMEKVVRDNSDQAYPEFNTNIPDSILDAQPTRFSRFGRFQQVFNATYVDPGNTVCKLPDYVDLYYPNDHGGGPNDINPNGPAWSYNRYVQDNDDALGRTVDLISHSPCWKDTVIFVVEDDTQNGLDHVNGARSIFLAISPWVKRQNVGKQHYSLSSIFKTVDLILGIPPLNEYDAAATDLRDIFTSTPDYTPYGRQTIQYTTQGAKLWGKLVKDIDFSRADADEVKLRNAIMKFENITHKPGKTGK